MVNRLRGSVLALCLVSVGPQNLHSQRARLLVSLPELQARLGQDSLDPVAHYDVALGYWVAGRFDDAERSLRRSVTIEPKFAPGHLGLAFLPYARRPKLWNEERKDKVPADWVAIVEESDRAYRRAFLIDPLVDLKIFGLVIPPREAIVIGRNATETYAALVRGFECFWDGQYAQSYDWLNSVLLKLDRGKEKDAPDVLLWYHGLAAAHVHRYDDAMNDFQRLLTRALAKEETDTLVPELHSPLESDAVCPWYGHPIGGPGRGGHRPVRAEPGKGFGALHGARGNGGDL